MFHVEHFHIIFSSNRIVYFYYNINSNQFQVAITIKNKMFHVEHSTVNILINAFIVLFNFFCRFLHFRFKRNREVSGFFGKAP